MNKHRYRIIFNKLRGLMMVVAEHVRSHSAAAETLVADDSDILASPALTADQAGATVALRPLAFSLMYALGLVVVIPNLFNIGEVHAEAIAAGNVPGNQRPTVLLAPNGVEVVNIQTPSAAGVSRNVYEKLNVPEQGMIFNNSRSNVQSELGGWIQGNPWLAAGTARIILNEINSSHPSYLNGFMEVAGSRAELIIANPNGISCNGCGFINASRGVLTTGTPILSGGDLIAYRVTSGHVNIWGNGLDATVALLNHDVHVNENGEAVDSHGNSTASTIAPIFDAEKVANEINAQVQITQVFSQQAYQAVGDYISSQRKSLQEQLKSAFSETDKAAIKSRMDELSLQERAMNILVGAVAGMGGTAVTKEGLALVADKMQQLMIEDSKRFAGVVDKDGKPLFSNISGDSAGVNGNGQKIAGTRADLDLLCGADTSRCKFEKNPDGSIDTSKPVTFTGDYQAFLKTEDGQKMLSAPFGGLQGGERTWLFGMPYEKGGWVDKLLESFAGPHDMIGGKVSGLYDEQGNTTRGRTDTTKMAHEIWSGVALFPAAPLAGAQGLPPEVWQAISILLKAGQ